MELTELEAAGLNASLYGPPADRVWLYVHGKGGCKEEAADFAALACPRGWQVLAADLPEHGARHGDGVLVLLRIASHTVGERTVGYFHLRAVYKDSLIEVIDLFLQLDSMMVPVALGSEY